MDIYDLDNDGSNEIIIEPEDHNTFYVLDHNGNFNWSGPATDNISSISFQDLYRDGTREVIVYSRDTTIPRGQISVFTRPVCYWDPVILPPPILTGPVAYLRLL